MDEATRLPCPRKGLVPSGAEKRKKRRLEEEKRQEDKVMFARLITVFCAGKYNPPNG